MRTSLLDWYADARRDLPWRGPGASAWGVYVSEIMAQQTQIDRVVPAWLQWMERWPTAAALAASSPADVVRQWGRLGYPRRALWMHAAASAMVALHDGEVPREDAALRALPGIGEYTAAAIRSFAFGERVAVLDVNVRRVHARVFEGVARPGTSVTNAEREHHERFLPVAAAEASALSQAVMEFGALVCTARDPGCDACPLSGACAWYRAGRPLSDLPARRPARFAGSDRACRGALMRVLRESAVAVPASRLEAAWADATQRARCLDGLMADGLVIPLSRNRFSLPV